MNKRIVSWKPVRVKDVYGREFLDSSMPALIAMGYRGELVDRINQMPKKSPISFEDAVNLAGEGWQVACVQLKFGFERGHSHWYHNNFIDFISEKGFHIELTGDELLSPSRSSN